jgi:hypothetical protein
MSILQCMFLSFSKFNGIEIFYFSTGSSHKSHGYIFTTEQLNSHLLTATDNWDVSFNYRSKQLCHPGFTSCRSGLANSRGEQLPVRRRLEVLGRTRERKGAGQKERGRRRASHRLHRLRPPLSASALSSHRGRRSTGVRWVAAHISSY